MHPCNTFKSQNTSYIEKGDPSMPILASHKLHSTLEMGTHPCNTCILNKTYTRKGNPSMQYMYIKCNLNEKGTHECNTYISNATHTRKGDPICNTYTGKGDPCI